MTIFQIALRNLMQRKVKSIFVMLGLAIGIATIVSIYSVLETMKLDIKSQMTDYGANILITADTGELTFFLWRDHHTWPAIRRGAADHRKCIGSRQPEVQVNDSGCRP